MSNALFADISSWQPAEINWPAYVAWSRSGDGIARVILRSSQGVGAPDPHFEAYWHGAIAAGVEVIGVYHYAYPNLQPGTSGAVSEANYLHQVVGARLRDQDFLMLDYEQNVPQATAEWALAFLEQTENNFGRLPKIYSYHSFIVEKLQDTRLARYPLIYALWTFDPSSRPAAPHPWADYEFLQYTDKGSVPGIAGRVDINVLTGGHTVVPAPPLPAPTPPPVIPPAPLPTPPHTGHGTYTIEGGDTLYSIAAKLGIDEQWLCGYNHNLLDAEAKKRGLPGTDAASGDKCHWIFPGVTIEY